MGKGFPAAQQSTAALKEQKILQSMFYSRESQLKRQREQVYVKEDGEGQRKAGGQNGMRR